MGRVVCKFGGTSLADAHQFAKVKAIVTSDSRRKVIVPSAPGKRHAQDVKLTDLLYLCQQTAALGSDVEPIFTRIEERFLEIEKDLSISANMKGELAELRTRLSQGVTRDFIASRGEYLSGLLLAQYLKAEFVDPADYIKITAQGGIDPETYRLLAKRLSHPDRTYVVPGFYGQGPQGEVKTFSRGGSDISGSIVARAIHADSYENWTDVSGLLMTDPRVVENPKPMEEATYAEIRELSYMGATVLHDEAISPVREVGIPIHIKNTNAPDHPGTRIVKKLSSHVEKNTEIAGIAGKKSFMMITIEKNLMNKEIGFAHRLFGIFERHRVSFEHCPSAIDSMSIIIEHSQIEGKNAAILDEIRNTIQPDRLEVEPQIALIAVVGEGMAKTIGIAAKVFSALRDALVNVRLINQGASELNIIVGVMPQDYEKSIKALYDAFLQPG